MTTDNIARFVEIKRQIATLTAQMEALKPSVIQDIRASGCWMVEHRGYDIMVVQHTTWSYSTATERLQITLSERKREEKANGTASVKEQRDIVIVHKRRQDGDLASTHATQREDRASAPRNYAPRRYTSAEKRFPAVQGARG